MKKQHTLKHTCECKTEKLYIICVRNGRNEVLIYRQKFVKSHDRKELSW